MPTFKFSEFRIYLSLMEICAVFLENCVEILAGLDSIDAKKEAAGKGKLRAAVMKCRSSPGLSADGM